MKKCFKCGEEKLLGQFYKHPRMGDGHLNKCIECTKNDVRVRAAELSLNDDWVNMERKRGREKYRRLYVGLGKTNPTSQNNWVNKFPEKKAAYSRSQYLAPPFIGAHGHHWSYNEEHYKDVIWLTRREHGKAHRFLEYSQEHRMYRIKHTGELLDTKEKHTFYIKYCIEFYED